MEILGVAECPGSHEFDIHPTYQIRDLDGNIDWLCYNDIAKVEN
jgi:hypothetical protein